MTIKEKEYLTLRRDVVFKNVFYRDKELLKSFLTSILGYFYDIKIDKIEIKNAELTKNRTYIKNKVIDILVYFGDKVINIELNNNQFSLIMKIRNLSYLFSTIVEDVHTGKKYSLKTEYIQINFNFQSKDIKGFKSYYLREDEDHNDILLKNIRIININVAFFLDEWYNSNNKKEYYEKYKYILLLGMTKEELSDIKDDDKVIKKIRNDVEKLNQNEDFYQLFTDEEDQEILNNSIYEEGLEYGMKQGSIDKTLDIAKKLLKMNMNISDIASATGLSLDEINNIKNN